MSERDFAPLQMPILDGPYRSMILGEPDNCRFRRQQGLRQPHRRDIDLGLFAEIETVRQPIERDLDPALLVDAIALGLDAGDLSLHPLVWT